MHLNYRRPTGDKSDIGCRSEECMETSIKLSQAAEHLKSSEIM